MKRLLPLVIITAVLAAASVGLLAATNASGDDNLPIRSDEDIDSGECNLVHSIDACTPQELEEAGIEVPDDGPPITSGDGIAPDECSLVHNLDACSAEQCQQLADDLVVCQDVSPDKPVTGDPAGPPPVRSDEGIAPDECSLVHNIEACEGGGVSPPNPGE